eukprot:366181-Chlamydomonas_euryale.AAC.3
MKASINTTGWNRVNRRRGTHTCAGGVRPSTHIDDLALSARRHGRHNRLDDRHHAEKVAVVCLPGFVNVQLSNGTHKATTSIVYEVVDASGALFDRCHGRVDRCAVGHVQRQDVHALRKCEVWT